MARKKKLTLEQEFEEAKIEHKAEIIMYVLMKKHKTIYNTKFFKQYKNMPAKLVKELPNLDEAERRAFWVEEDITYRDANGEAGLYDRVYEFCWKRASKLIKENMIARQKQADFPDFRDKIKYYQTAKIRVLKLKENE